METVVITTNIYVVTVETVDNLRKGLKRLFFLIECDGFHSYYANMNSYYNGFQRFPQLLRKYEYFPQRFPRLLNGEARCAAGWGLPGRAGRRAAPPCPARQAPPCGAPRLPVPLGPYPLRRAAPPCPTGQARNTQGGQEGLLGSWHGRPT